MRFALLTFAQLGTERDLEPVRQIESERCSLWVPVPVLEVPGLAREDDRLRLYLNGHQVACSDSIPASCYDLDTAVPMYLGFGSVDYFSGDMEDVRMYCRALHREDVATLASQSAGDSPW